MATEESKEAGVVREEKDVPLRLNRSPLCKTHEQLMTTRSLLPGPYDRPLAQWELFTSTHTHSCYLVAKTSTGHVLRSEESGGGTPGVLLGFQGISRPA
jgi:hypothetical protein